VPQSKISVSRSVREDLENFTELHMPAGGVALGDYYRDSSFSGRYSKTLNNVLSTFSERLYFLSRGLNK